MLSVRAINSRYSRIEVLHGVSIEVASGEIVALIGSNGAGKTTLLRAISGIQPISHGEILLAGRRIDRLAAHKRVRLGLGHVPEGRQIFGPLTVEENLLVGAWTNSSRCPPDLERIYAFFPILADFRHRAAGALSGGQQQMLAIGRALVSNPEILLLDEPSMGLAPLLIDQIFSILQDIRSTGLTILLVEQNAHAALSIADRAYVLETGRVSLEGNATALSRDPRVRAAYLGI